LKSQYKKIGNTIDDSISANDIKIVLETAKKEAVFEVKSADPVIIKRAYGAAITFFAGLITGLVFGILWVTGKNYFYENRN